MGLDREFSAPFAQDQFLEAMRPWGVGVRELIGGTLTDKGREYLVSRGKGKKT